MSTYVVGDIHGCYKSWIALKSKIEKQDPEAVFILVGDIVDRGPDTVKMLDWAMENITADGKYQMIIGNHEFEKLDILTEFFECRPLDENTSYSQEALYDLRQDTYDFKDKMIAHKVSVSKLYDIYCFFLSLPYYKEFDITMEKKLQHYIVVHGGLPLPCINKDETFRKRSILLNVKEEERAFQNYLHREDIVWSRVLTGNPNLKRTIVVHGHTPTISAMETTIGAIPAKICFKSHDINVDCGEVYRNTTRNMGNLAAIRLEDLKEFYVHSHGIGMNTELGKTDSLFNFPNMEKNKKEKQIMLEKYTGK